MRISEQLGDYLKYGVVAVIQAKLLGVCRNGSKILRSTFKIQSVYYLPRPDNR